MNKNEASATAATVTLPRVLVNARRDYALELMRGHKFSHIIDTRNGISYERVPLPKLNAEWKEYGTDQGVVRHFAEVCLGSFRSKTVRAERTLREIMMSTIDVQKASTAELVDFFNSKQTDEKKKIKKFADRATAEKRVTALLASLAGTSVTGGDADAPLPPEPSNNSTSTTTKGTTMATKSKKAKSTKPGKSTKSSASRPKKSAGAGDISKGVKASWSDKKVAAARSKKDKVKVGGEVFGSLQKAFEKLKLSMSGFTNIRKELKAKGRLTHEGHTFTIVPSEA